MSEHLRTDTIQEYTVPQSASGTRIDKYLADLGLCITRSRFQNLIREGHILVNQTPVKPNYKLNGLEQISIRIPEPEPADIVPEDIPLSVLYEDEDIILINKPKDMVVHPAPGHYSGTIVNALMHHCRGNLSGINGSLRPGIVHRIDRNTTGVIVACKNDRAHNSLAAQLKEHTITRRYEAIVYNHFSQPEGIVDAPIGRHPGDRKKMAVNYRSGREAVTHYKVIENLAQNFTHISCRLETGRTHQIRVHMASIQHPLLGDDVYGPGKSKFQLEGQVLHARVLGFCHPSTGEYMEFESPLPEYFKHLLSILKL